MRRRDVLALLGGTAMSLPLLAHAQQKGMPVIGFLSGVSASTLAPRLIAFRQGLSASGYIEGQNVAIEYRWADGDYDRLPALAADLVGRSVDVIATSGSNNSTLAAKRATATIPIAFVVGDDPVAMGLVSSLARPGSNLTGVSFLVVDLAPKLLEQLIELVSDIKAIALLVNPINSNAERLIKDTQGAALAKGLKLHVLKASTAGEIDAAFTTLAQRAGGVIVSSDPFLVGQRDQLVALAANSALPTIYPSREPVEVGGLISYGPGVVGVYHQLGIYVGKILKGAKPADLPIEQPTKFELVVNLKTAKTLGLTIPQSVLARADEVIE